MLFNWIWVLWFLLICWLWMIHIGDFPATHTVSFMLRANFLWSVAVLYHFAWTLYALCYLLGLEPLLFAWTFLLDFTRTVYEFLRRLNRLVNRLVSCHNFWFDTTFGKFQPFSINDAFCRFWNSLDFIWAITVLIEGFV